MRKQQQAKKGLGLLGASLLGLFISLGIGFNSPGIAEFSVVVGQASEQPAVWPAHLETARSSPGQPIEALLTELEEQGRQLYREGQFLAAISQWQKIAQVHAEQANLIAQASALSNLSLAYQQLGQWEDAQAAVAASLSLLTAHPLTDEQQRVTAQALMTQGSLQTALGQPQQALETWQQAATAYRQSDDIIGLNRAQINQSQALREMGFYRQAVEKLTEARVSLESQPPSLLQAVLWRRLGETQRLTGALKQAQATLRQSLAMAEEYVSPIDISAALLSLGHTAWSRRDPLAAKDLYMQASAALVAPAATERLPIQLAQLALAVETQEWPAMAELWLAIQSQFECLPPSRTAIYHQVNWAHSLIQFKQAQIAAAPSWLTIAQQLQQAVHQARDLKDTRAEAYAVGTLGQVYEQTQQWAIAQALTQQALNLSSVNALDSAYQWQWQLGRIWRSPDNPQQSISKSIAAYSQAIDILSRLRGDIASVRESAQFSFTTRVEPVYRQLVALLLPAEGQPANPEDLIRAQAVIESLRLAELDNYFQQACIDIQPVSIDQVDPRAAIAYTIVLEDRLSVILRLPNQPLQHFSTEVPASAVSEITTQLRQQLVIRSRRQYLPLAQQVYQWLIAPAREAIDSSVVDTIVFVLDGPLQNVPMASLHDGKHFLIEDYSVALMVGLKLLNPHPWEPSNLSVLVAGLTESRLGLLPLPYVAQEVEQITAAVKHTTVLLNQDFTEATLPNKIKSARYPIVHIATHGQFGSTPEETYLVAWDKRIDIEEIAQMLQADRTQRSAIELLILSACETASGDQRATLGLAGVTVKAGARSTLATLWAINDEATAHFIGQFYQQITQVGATRASALRAAQLEMIKDLKYQHPIDWAPYVLLGSWL
ncbi:MAG: CHAT domain-containing protein [Phormidesmis sp.]